MKTFIFLIFVLVIFRFVIRFCRKFYNNPVPVQISPDVLLDYLKQQLALQDHRSYWYTDLPWEYEVKEVTEFLRDQQLGDLPERAINEYLSDQKTGFEFYRI